jgi:hypothetical protein
LHSNLISNEGKQKVERGISFDMFRGGSRLLGNAFYLKFSLNQFGVIIGGF